MKKKHELSGPWKANPYYARLGERGRKQLLERYYASEGLIRLDEDLVAAFPDSETVNETLRLALKLKGVLAKAKRTTTKHRSKKTA